MIAFVAKWFLISLYSLLYTHTHTYTQGREEMIAYLGENRMRIPITLLDLTEPDFTSWAEFIDSVEA